MNLIVEVKDCNMYLAVYPLVSTIILYAFVRKAEDIKHKIFVHFLFVVGVCAGKFVWGKAVIEDALFAQAKLGIIFLGLSLTASYFFSAFLKSKEEKKKEFQNTFTMYWTGASALSIVLSDKFVV